MAGIEIKIDVASVKSRFNDLADKDVPFLTAFALTKTMQAAQVGEREEMERLFDQPVDWTLNSLQVVTASKTDNPITAQLKFREFGGKGTPAWKYLTPEIEGGERRHKSHERRLIAAGIMHDSEYAVPGEGVTLDANGNMPGSLLEQILSQLQAAGGSGYASNQTSRSRKRSKGGQQGLTYFVLRGTKAANGIYLRRSAERTIKPILIFVRPPSYAPRFGAYDLAKQFVHDNFIKFFSDGFAKYAGGPRDLGPS